MDYYQFAIACPPETTDILIAFMAEQPFDTFEETEGGFTAYLPASADLQAVESDLAGLREQFEFSFEKTFLPGQNWNAVWESNFQPITVGDFCGVRADFHAPFGGSVRHELVINPKMAFGSGHHETTWMCLAALENLPVAGAKILDYGCGTGILAILASRLGASDLEAVDIENESFLNTQENCAVNGVTNVVARCGTLADVQGCDFDGILANINRNVILDSLPRLAQILRPGGWLLVSGILREDEAMVCDAAAAQGFSREELQARGNWLCIRFAKGEG